MFGVRRTAARGELERAAGILLVLGVLSTAATLAGARWRRARRESAVDWLVVVLTLLSTSAVVIFLAYAMGRCAALGRPRRFGSGLRAIGFIVIQLTLAGAAGFGIWGVASARMSTDPLGPAWLGVWSGVVSALCAPIVGVVAELMYLAQSRAALRRANQCLRCGYDLTGNTTGRCPECGEPATALSGMERAEMSEKPDERAE